MREGRSPAQVGKKGLSNHRWIVVFRIACLALAGMASSAISHAQGGDGVSQELAEVLVTAERHEVNLQDVPASATVLDAEALAASGVDNVIEIQSVAPSVAVNTYNRSTFINIRGVGIAQSAPTSNPGVAVYIDGNFIPHETFIAQSFYDIDSIEVLRGPQGTLTGQNSTGGAVYMRTPSPEMGQWNGYLDVTAAASFHPIETPDSSPSDAAASTCARSPSSRGSTDCVSGSPNRQLNSRTRSPSSVSISPA